MGSPANILPPPQATDLTIVKLLSHPTYRAYQSHISSLSLFANVYVKFTPPAWGEPTPKDKDSKEAKEWKRKIKMYRALISSHCCASYEQLIIAVLSVGPAVEAFGYQRILFGSSPSPSSSAASAADDWYELARQSIAELGIEQEDVDAVFCANAKKLYGSP